MNMTDKQKRTRRTMLKAASAVSDSREIIFGLCANAERELKTYGSVSDVFKILKEIQAQTVSLAEHEDNLYMDGQKVGHDPH